ncbi:MAG: hypothetical protein AAGM38_16860 [Pseudomonadota bacterium]
MVTLSAWSRALRALAPSLVAFGLLAASPAAAQDCSNPGAVCAMSLAQSPASPSSMLIAPAP